MLLALDLSTKQTGYAVFDFKGNLISVEQITPPPNLTLFRKIFYVVQHLKLRYPKIQEVVIEDVFLGKNVKSLKELSKLAGAVIYSWMEHSGEEPTFLMAISARKLLNIDVKSQKSDLQFYVLQRFYKNINLDDLQTQHKAIRKEYVNRKITKSSLEYRLGKFSELISERTNVSNDKADAIIVGLAYLVKKGYIKE